MRTNLRTMTLCCLLGACDAKLVGNLPDDKMLGATTEGATDGVSTTGGPATAADATSETTADATTVDTTEITVDTTTAVDATVDTTTTTDADDTAADTGTSSTTDQGIAPECMGVDHSTCFASVIDACHIENGWTITPACVDGVAQCYPLGPGAGVSPIDVINLCGAEFDSTCFDENAPGCGATFCDCMAGAFPFDWTNCWHLVTTACRYGPNSDCDAVLSTCYPGATKPEFEACFQQVYEDVGHECDCPMCSIHEQCEAGLAECLAG